jgi:hypothetical protein
MEASEITTLSQPYVLISDSHTGIVDSGRFWDVHGGGQASPVRSKNLTDFAAYYKQYMGTSNLCYYPF